MSAALAWVLAHPLLAYLAASVVLSSVWYAVRGAVWPATETAKLPTWARVVQALVECAANLPGALRAAGVMASSAGPRAPGGA